MQEVLAVDIPEAARRLGLSTRTVATLVSRQELPSRKVGRRRIIPVAALEAFLKGEHGPVPTAGKAAQSSYALEAKAGGSPRKAGSKKTRSHSAQYGPNSA